MIGVFITALALSFIDDAGRSVTVPAKPTRIMAAGPPAAVWIYALAPEALAGWTRAFKDDERELVPEPYRSLPVTGRLTGHGGTASLESLAAAKPDIIVDIGTVDATHAALADRVQAQLGVPYVLLGGTLSESAKTFRRLGELTGRPQAAEALATYVDGLLKLSRDAVAADAKRPKVYFARGPAGLETALAGSLFAEVITLAGAENIARAGDTDAIVTVPFEAIIKAAPTVIVTQDSGFAQRAASEASWRALSARVLLAPKAPFGWLDAPPSVNRVLGLVWLTAQLHPMTWDARETIATFYERLYHIRLSEQQLTRMLPR